MTEYPIPTLKTWLEATMKPAKPYQRGPKKLNPAMMQRRRDRARQRFETLSKPKVENLERLVDGYGTIPSGAASSIWHLAELVAV